MTHIAVIGSGPSGCYIADTLAKKAKDAQIDVFDRLPTPFGLVRAGVAPDHQGTKNISRQLGRAFSRENVRFAGNVCIGQDLSYDELKEHYDVVVITTGAHQDRRLGIAGEELNGVYGSGEFSRWYNGHPDQAHQAPLLDGKAIAIIGNGNVALDLARLLAKTPEERNGSDITAAAEGSLSNSTVTDIYLIGRRGPLDASFTNMELSELGELSRCAINIDPADLPEQLPEGLDAMQAMTLERNLETLRSFAERDDADRPVRLHMKFYASPEAISGDARISALTLRHNQVTDGRVEATDQTTTLQVDTLISAIGFSSKVPEGLPYDDSRGTVKNEDGVVESGVYTAGWCKRGPQGVIPANRADAMAVAKLILADLEQQDSSEKSGFAAVAQLLDSRQVQATSFEDAEKIDAAEVSRAPEGKPREKFTRVDEMLALINQG